MANYDFSIFVAFAGQRKSASRYNWRMDITLEDTRLFAPKLHVGTKARHYANRGLEMVVESLSATHSPNNPYYVHHTIDDKCWLLKGERNALRLQCEAPYRPGSRLVYKLNPHPKNPLLYSGIFQDDIIHTHESHFNHACGFWLKRKSPMVGPLELLKQPEYQTLMEQAQKTFFIETSY